MFGLVIFEIMKEIKLSLKGIRLIILLVEFLCFILFFHIMYQDVLFIVLMTYEMILISLTIALLLRPQMHRILFIVPISVEERYKYFEYKALLIVLINITIYMLLLVINSEIFKIDYLDSIIFLWERYIPMLIFVCAYAVAIENRLVKTMNKLDNILVVFMLLPIINLELGTMGAFNNKELNLIIVLLSYISATISYIIVIRKLKPRIYKDGYEVHSKYIGLKGIYGDYMKKRKRSYECKHINHK